MGSRQRVIVSVSLPPETAKEYKRIAKGKGTTASEFFREMFSFYKREKLEEEFRSLQAYGARKAKKLKLTEEEIERLIFEGR
ncbi:MAG: CopG family transcriptional regulator [Deltaproteobacteria bacterium]|nr:CopG family transcriptional regulator [Deltaproteobacteria bacterium]